MSDIHTGQMLRLRFDTGQDLTSASNKKILYNKPDGTAGGWTATAELTTFLYYDTAEADLDQPGMWKLQTYCEIAGKKLYGDIVVENVKLKLN